MENYLNQVLGGRYEIQEVIGVGGMACVYKAYDRVDDRTVAVKILRDEFLADEDMRNRFKNESQAIAVLSHPNIVKVYDFFFSENLQYIVMEYVDGITLKDYIKQQGVLNRNIAIHFVTQILRALQHAHDKGIIHRDVKPENILLLPNASLKVTDFGIARFNRSEINSVGEYKAIGSVHYVSPEQARGEYTDERSDIYSVGVVLYEMLTGKKPFESEEDEKVAIMQVQSEPVRLTQINPSVPVGLEQITQRAMQKNAADRYGSASEFLADINAFKNNPKIHFDYSYLDKTPTKYMEFDAMKKDAYTEKEKNPKPSARSKRDEDDEEEDGDDGSQRSSVLTILSAVAVSLVLVIGLVVVIMFGGTIKSFFSGDSRPEPESSEHSDGFFDRLFGRDKIEVPNFINMQFEDVLKKYPGYAIENPPQYEYNSGYEDGHVCKQYPDAGTKVSKDTVFKLTVATNNQMVLIRDVSGLQLDEAEAMLTSSGLTVEKVAVADKDKKNGEVLYTDPSPNTYAEYMGVVYVYYASASSDTKTVRVPDVRGYGLNAAKAKLKDVGLTLGSVTEGSSEPALKGFVISQSPSAMVSVNSTAVVNLIVGNGIPASSTAVFRIFLPSMPTSAVGTIKTFLDDKPYDSIAGVPLNGSSYQLSFTGKKPDSTFKIYVDEILIYTGNIDFTVSPAKCSNVHNYQFSKKLSVPNVVGFTESAAQTALSAAGFDRVRFIYETDENVPAGNVVSQFPVFSEHELYLPTITVTITVSTGAPIPETTLPPETTTAVLPETTVPPESSTEPFTGSPGTTVQPFSETV